MFTAKFGYKFIEFNRTTQLFFVDLLHNLRVSYKITVRNGISAKTIKNFHLLISFFAAFFANGMTVLQVALQES